MSPRLELRQAQSLVMTPQLQQAIKLLALSNLEIEAFIGEAIEGNPLLEGGDAALEPGDISGEFLPAPNEPAGEPLTADLLMLAGGGEADAPLDIDPAALDRDRDTGDGSTGDVSLGKLDHADGDAGDWASAASSGSAGGDDGPDIDERGAGQPTLSEHLEAQVGPAARDERQAFIARAIVALLDEAGYLATPMAEIAEMLGVSAPEVEAALAVVQSLDPTGVGARSLAECLALQAREADRYDPCMALLIDHLALLGEGKLSQLKRMCGVDDEDFADMLAELRGYDPKPGLQFGPGERGALVPDILVQPAGRGGGDGWDIVLNPATLPRLVVNRDYYLELRGACADVASKGWLSEKLTDANWLVKALDQRQKTILKVAAEIVRRQEGFFRHGVSELRPLTMRLIAETIDMHESTVSRVAANKFLACDRGTFELKFFFTSAVGTGDGEEGASSAVVKARIRALVDGEAAAKVLSDDSLVDLLRAEGFDLARRTVAKYREAIGIGSSVERRRQKRLACA